MGSTKKTSSIRHLGVFVNSTGIDTKAHETKLLTTISARIVSWQIGSPSLQGKVLLINTFLSSQFYYLAHVFPLSQSFYDNIYRAFQRFLWGKNPLARIDKLFPPKNLGGLGLTDYRDVANRMYGKKVLKVLDPEVTTGWEVAQNNIYYFELLKSHPTTSNSLAYVLISRLRRQAQGPADSTPDLKAFLRYLKQDDWSISRRDLSAYESRHRKYDISRKNELLIHPYSPSKPTYELIIPEAALDLSTANSKLIWSHLHSPMIISQIKSMAWRYIRGNVRTVERTGTAVRECPTCLVPDSMRHRIIDCDLMKLVWINFKLLFPLIEPIVNNKINWLGVRTPGLSELDSIIPNAAFQTAIWVAHNAIVDRINDNPPNPFKILNSFKSHLTTTLERIFFGK